MAAPAPVGTGGGLRADEAPPIRVMIVDDSPIARSVLARMISTHRDLSVEALAANAGEALDKLETARIDVVLLDLEMPGTSGFEALPQILERGRGARVLTVSSLCEDRAEATVKALALGAADTLPKPGTGNFGGRFSEVLADRVRRIGRAEPASPRFDESDAPILLRPMPVHPLGCLALGASTGGLHALAAFLKALPGPIGVPILITQHLPPLFVPFFTRQIEAASGRRATVAEDGDMLLPDQILVAPGEAHLGLGRSGSHRRVRLCHSPASSGCRPSVDPMFWSVAESFGCNGLAVVFSGMGRDGLVGAARLVQSGGAVLVQDRATSAVWGMPRAVAEAGLASAILPPAELAARIAARAGAKPWR